MKAAEPEVVLGRPGVVMAGRRGSHILEQLVGPPGAPSSSSLSLWWNVVLGRGLTNLGGAGWHRGPGLGATCLSQSGQYPSEDDAQQQ